MRILLASDHYPPFIGGAQRQTQVLASELAARGHEVAVATVWQDDLPARPARGGVAVLRLRQLRTLPLLRGSAAPPAPAAVRRSRDGAYALRRLLGAVRARRRARRRLVLLRVRGRVCGAARCRCSSPRATTASAARPPRSCTRRAVLGPGARQVHGVRGLSLRARRRGGPPPPACSARGGQLAAAPGRPAQHQPLRERDERARLPRRRRAAARCRTTIPSFRVEDSAGRGPPGAGGAAARAVHPVRRRAAPGQGRGGAAERIRASARTPPPLVLLGTREADTPAHAAAGARDRRGDAPLGGARAWERSLFGVTPSLWPEPFGSVVHEAMSRGRAVIGTTPGATPT